jgi:hypothetical protein
MELSNKKDSIGLIKAISLRCRDQVKSSFNSSLEFVEYIETMQLDSLICADKALWARVFEYAKGARPWLATQIVSSWLEKALFNALVAQYFISNPESNIDDIPPTEESKLKKMKDILDHPLLSSVVFASNSALKLAFLKTFMGTIDYMNIRNMLWHGFLTESEFPIEFVNVILLWFCGESGRADLTYLFRYGNFALVLLLSISADLVAVVDECKRARGVSVDLLRRHNVSKSDEALKTTGDFLFSAP